MSKVSVNAPKTPVTKGSGGIASATMPNVCKMPGPPAPFVPTPLPNIGKSGKDPKDYSKSVFIEGKEVAIAGASFGSMGDVAAKGTGGGLISSNVEGPTKFIGPGSFDVQVEGKNVQLLGDPMLNNCGPSGAPPNAATMTGIVQAPSTDMQIQYGDDTVCLTCLEIHEPIAPGPLTRTMVTRLFTVLDERAAAQADAIREHPRRLDEIRRLEDDLITLPRRRQRGEFTREGFEAEKARIQMRIAALRLEMAPLQDTAILHWHEDYDTYLLGYMIGAASCKCTVQKAFAAESNYTTPGFKAAVLEANFELASDGDVPTASERDQRKREKGMAKPKVPPPPKVEQEGEEEGDGWSSAAKQIFEAMSKARHRPGEMLERWFAPFITDVPVTKPRTQAKERRGKGRKPQLVSEITTRIKTFDAEGNRLGTATRTKQYGSGDDTPSCQKCQEDLPMIICETRCPGGGGHG